jgi:hypothetical protein
MQSVGTAGPDGVREPGPILLIRLCRLRHSVGCPCSLPDQSRHHIASLPQPPEADAFKSLCRRHRHVECLLDLTTCDDRPDDPRRLVRHGDGSHPDGLSREQVGEARVHSLAPEVRALLAGITKVEKSDLVFTTTGKTPVSGFTKAKARLDGDVQELRAKAAAEVGKSAPEAIPGWRLHDFRRTAVTWMASNGIAPHVADRLLNHIQGTISGVAAIYQPGEFLAERKAALGAWAGWVTKT